MEQSFPTGIGIRAMRPLDHHSLVVVMVDLDHHLHHCYVTSVRNHWLRRVFFARAIVSFVKVRIEYSIFNIQY